jgi:hypothetical protein
MDRLRAKVTNVRGSKWPQRKVWLLSSVTHGFFLLIVLSMVWLLSMFLTDKGTVLRSMSSIYATTYTTARFSTDTIDNAKILQESENVGSKEALETNRLQMIQTSHCTDVYFRGDKTWSAMATTTDKDTRMQPLSQLCSCLKMAYRPVSNAIDNNASFDGGERVYNSVKRCYSVAKADVIMRSSDGSTQNTGWQAMIWAVVFMTYLAYSVPYSDETKTGTNTGLSEMCLAWAYLYWSLVGSFLICLAVILSQLNSSNWEVVMIVFAFAYFVVCLSFFSINAVGKEVHTEGEVMRANIFFAYALWNTFSIYSVYVTQQGGIHDNALLAPIYLIFAGIVITKCASTIVEQNSWQTDFVAFVFTTWLIWGYSVGHLLSIVFVIELFKQIVPSDDDTENANKPDIVALPNAYSVTMYRQLICSIAVLCTLADLLNRVNLSIQ